MVVQIQLKGLHRILVEAGYVFDGINSILNGEIATIARIYSARVSEGVMEAFMFVPYAQIRTEIRDSFVKRGLDNGALSKEEDELDCLDFAEQNHGIENLYVNYKLNDRTF